jgi:hypothetical protein
MKKEFAYLLGYLFADGYLGKRKSTLKDGSVKIYHQSKIEIATEDSYAIEYCLKECDIKYTVSTRKRKNWKDQTLFIISRDNVCINYIDFVLSNKLNMNYAISIFRKDLILYFIRGFFDGDGSIYVNEKHYIRQVVFSGPIDYNWTFLLNLFTELGINASEKNIIRKNNNKYSHLRFTKSNSVISFFEFIYPDKIFDFGLYRKFEKLDKVIAIPITSNN